MSPTTTNQDRLSPPLTTPSDHLHGVAMLDMLKSDPRPTFLLDAKNTGKPIFWNHALAGLDSRRLLNALLAKTDEDDDDFHKFQAWAAKAHKSVGSTSTYCGCIWNVVLVKDRWTVISGTPAHASTEEVQNNLSPGNSHNLYRVSSNRQSSTFDWTCDPPPVRISAHIAWARSIDWASTPLGPMNTWSSQLRSIANLIMQDPRPAVIYWGPDLILLYNEPYIELLGGFHPCMGVSARIALVEVWEPIFEPFITQNIAGETVERTNTPVHMVRNEFMEETYFSFRFIPIFDSDGITIGHYQTLAETTREVVAQRRAQTLLQLSEQVPRARNSDAYWTLATDVLSRNDKDVPFALLYSVEAGFESDTNSNTTRYSDNHQECTLRGHFGLPKDCLAAPVQLEINQERGFAPYFRQAMLARNPIMIPFSEGSPAADLVRGIEWKGYGNPCRGAVICPINPTSSKDNILGYLVIGLNPRRPYDDDYRQFIMVASRLLSTSLTSILLHEEDIHRRERAIANAESMKIELRQQLLDTQKEVERSAYKFQRFAERADIGIFIVGVDGAYSYRNDAWYHILDPDFITRDIVLGEAWGALIEDEYAALGQSKFETLIETKQHQ
jgi:PAS domain-containing protein